MRKIMLVLFGLMLTLSACSMTKKQLGLSRDVPDESTVETRRPLDLPPDYNILPD